jgi:hypothetical protein
VGGNFRLLLTDCCCGNKLLVKAKRTLANRCCAAAVLHQRVLKKSKILSPPGSFFVFPNSKIRFPPINSTNRILVFHRVFELTRRLPTLRCSDCHQMQLPRHPFIHPFRNRHLCDACRIDDKYRFVTAYTAKKNYFLDENDLLSLRTFSQKNPHYKLASHVRFFSRVDVQRRSELKLELLQTTRKDRLKKRDLRSQQAKDRWGKQVANRRDHIIQVLTDSGFPSASKHYCTAVDGFVRNRLNGRRVRGTSWAAEDVIQI